MDYYTLNADGTYTLISDKLVPEKDLLTIKGSSETAKKQFESEIEGLKKSLDEMTARATTAESAAEAVKTELEPLKEASTKVTTLEAQVKDLTEKHTAATTRLLEATRDSFITKYGLKGEQAEKVKSMSSEDITKLEDNAAIFGFKPVSNGNGSKFDNGGSRGLDTEGMTGSQMVRAGLEQGLLSGASNSKE